MKRHVRILIETDSCYAYTHTHILNYSQFWSVMNLRSFIIPGSDGHRLEETAKFKLYLVNLNG